MVQYGRISTGPAVLPGEAMQAPFIGALVQPYPPVHDVLGVHVRQRLGDASDGLTRVCLAVGTEGHEALEQLATCSKGEMEGMGREGVGDMHTRTPGQALIAVRG